MLRAGGEVTGFKSRCHGEEQGWIQSIVSLCLQVVSGAPVGLVKVFNHKVQIWLQKKHLACLCQYCEAAKLEQTNQFSVWLLV